MLYTNSFFFFAVNNQVIKLDLGPYTIAKVLYQKPIPDLDPNYIQSVASIQDVDQMRLIMCTVHVCNQHSSYSVRVRSDLDPMYFQDQLYSGSGSTCVFANLHTQL